MPRSVALIVPNASRSSEDFFPDTLLGLLCAEARGAGHRAELARVYYEGDRGAGDAEAASRLRGWLEEIDADLVVFERLFDPSPVRAHLEARAGRRAVLVSRGEAPEDAFDLVVGGAVVEGSSRRAPHVRELVDAFSRLLEAMEGGRDPCEVAGVARVGADPITPPVPARSARPRPLHPVLEHRVISVGAPPRRVRKTVFGNAGCPYSADVAASPLLAGLDLPRDGRFARLGCAFCAIGGDYQKRPADVTVAETVEQAVWITRGAPEIEELVLADQHPLPYLAQALEAARAAGARPVRWLFAARPDVIVRERRLLEEVVAAAGRTQQAVEVYLSGFEAFCDRELARYNKGLTVSDLLAAVGILREIAAANPGRFEYARARGHSLILWNPWTSPEDLAESVRNLRRHGLAELFSDVAANRLRLHAALPLTAAAERDGALCGAWEDEAAAVGKGYGSERPWRFLDPRTRLAFRLSRSLRERFGVEGELAQLEAVADFASRSRAAELDVPAAAAGVVADLERLAEGLARLDGPRRPKDLQRGLCSRATPILFAGGCNNGCTACPNRDTWMADGVEALRARVDAARRSAGPLVFAGREPTLHPEFVELLARARGDDERQVGIVTNGRRFAIASFARAAAGHLAAASVKLLGPDARSADAVARAPGAHEQALAGARALARLGVEIEARVTLHRHALADVEGYLRGARAAGARQLRVGASLDGIGLDRLGEAADALGRLAERCRREGMPLEATRLGLSVGALDHVPVATSGRTPGREARAGSRGARAGAGRQDGEDGDDG